MNESSESEDFNEDDNNVGEDGERIFKKGTKVNFRLAESSLL